MDAPTLAAAVGSGARALRTAGGVTLSQVADAARFCGLPWSSGKVGDFESGRVSPSLPTYLAVASALSNVLDRPVALPDLLTGVTGRVAVSSRITMDADHLRAVLSGAAVDLAVDDLVGESDQIVSRVRDALTRRESFPAAVRKVKMGVHLAVAHDFGDGDLRIARSLNIDPELAAAAMAAAWGRTFVQQRDLIAGPDATPQKKGRVSRQLKSELLAVVDNGDDQ
jgi:transcriptional regulator with XRE-family HTH domain